MQKHTGVAVIGGGASGFAAAIAAAQILKQPFSVTLLEGAPKVGRKLLATGNGRCNLTNMHATVKHYYGNPGAVEAILHTYPPKRLIEWFREMGLLCKEETQGRVYPHSLQASSVLDMLRLRAETLQVETICEFPVCRLKNENGVFFIESVNGQTLIAKKVILATGGKAAPQLGCGINGYALASSFGHIVTPLYPALTALKTPPEFVKGLKGMRCPVTAVLKCNGKVICLEKGEVQFTEQGLSGICMFQFSRHVALLCAKRRQPEVILDFMPEHTVFTITKQLEYTAQLFPNQPAAELLKGFINKLVGESIVKRVLSNKKNAAAKELRKTDLTNIANAIKGLAFPCIGVTDWKQAQTTAGGVSLRQISGNLESTRCKGLYFSGEILNIDGECGGYNLHWAWISGITAGKAAAKSIKRTK